MLFTKNIKVVSTSVNIYPEYRCRYLVQKCLIYLRNCHRFQNAKLVIVGGENRWRVWRNLLWEARLFVQRYQIARQQNILGGSSSSISEMNLGFPRLVKLRDWADTPPYNPSSLVKLRLLDSRIQSDLALFVAPVHRILTLLQGLFECVVRMVKGLIQSFLTLRIGSFQSRLNALGSSYNFVGLLAPRVNFNPCKDSCDSNGNGRDSNRWISEIWAFYEIPPPYGGFLYFPWLNWWGGSLACLIGASTVAYGFMVLGLAFSREGTWSTALSDLAIIAFGVYLIHLGFAILRNNTVPQKYFLTSSNYWGTVISIESTQMANILATETKVAIMSALAEGPGIFQIERMQEPRNAKA